MIITGLIIREHDKAETEGSAVFQADSGMIENNKSCSRPGAGFAVQCADWIAEMKEKKRVKKGIMKMTSNIMPLAAGYHRFGV